MLGKASHGAGMSYSSDGNPDQPGDTGLQGTVSDSTWDSRPSSLGEQV